MSTDCQQQQQSVEPQAAAVPPATSAAITAGSSEPQMLMVQADYSAAYYYTQPAPVPYAYSSASDPSGVQFQQAVPQPYYPQELVQPHCVYYYPPPPMCVPGPDPMAAAAVYGQGVAASMPSGYAAFYHQPAAAGLTMPPPPPPPHQQQPMALPPSSQPLQPPPLMQQQPLLMPPSTSASSMTAGGCPCCSAPRHHQMAQPTIQLPPLPQPPPQAPQPQLLREQSRSSSCDSAYRTVSTSDLADINQNRPTPQQLLVPSQQQPWVARRNSQQQQQVQIQKRWKTGYLRNILYKTEMCRDVAQRGACPRGVTCQFAHSEAELLSPSQHPLYKTAFCFDYKNRGHCQRGDHCFHAHQPGELRPAPPAEMQTPPSAACALLRPLPQQQLSGSGVRRESTPRSLAGGLPASAGAFKTLTARLGGGASGSGSLLASAKQQLHFSAGGSPQFSTERRLSLTSGPASRSGY